MRMRHAALVLILALEGTAALATDVGTIRGCIVQAREELQQCSAECINDFRNEKFTCRNVEPGCGRECLGRRESCIETASESLVECVGGCQTALVAAKAACALSCGSDASCLDTCIDSAQVDAFTCRDECREDFRTSGGREAIELCRTTFRECVRACPPAE